MGTAMAPFTYFILPPTTMSSVGGGARRRSAEVRNHGTHVQHGRELDAEFARGVHGNAKAEGVADRSGL